MASYYTYTYLKYTTPRFLTQSWQLKKRAHDFKLCACTDAALFEPSLPGYNAPATEQLLHKLKSLILGRI